LAWGVRQRLPSHVAEVRDGIAALTGCSAQIAKVTHPRPGVTILHEVELQDPATDEAILRAERLLIDDRGVDRRLVLTRPWIASAGMHRLWQALSPTIDGWRGEAVTELFADTLDLEFGVHTLSLQDLQARLHTADEGPQFEAQFIQAGGEGLEPAEIRVTRDLQNQSVRYEFSTGQTPFPCQAVGNLAPALASLGPEATFQGRVAVTAKSHDWTASLIGPAAIAGLDLESLTRDYCGRRLTGPARLDLKLLNLGNGAITSVDGDLHSGPGEIDAALLYSFGDALGVAHGLPPNRAEGHGVGAYQELGVGFSINRDGALIRGTCGASSGSLLMIQGQPFAQEPAGRCSIDALVRALTPASVGYVPATRQAERLLQRLPLTDGAGEPTSITSR
jgi:hypothetical protein